MSNPEGTRSGPAAPVVDESAIQAFRARLAGEIVRPGDAGFDDARAVWNGMIDRRPTLVARCASVKDVVESVSFARAHGLLVAVRGGGHNVAGFGTCDGGLVIDLSRLKQIDVDPVRRVARAGGGVRWGELDQATQAHGLATPGGVVSDTGIAGLTLGGGYGWLRNKYGLSCDNLISAEVVTADGRVLTASETENPDLFWGLRGGGGNFGVVTTFEYRLHPVGPEVMFCFVFHSARRAVEVLRFFREYTAHAPDEISVLAFCGIVPPGATAFPEETHGQHYVAFIGAFVGPVEEGERVVRPLRELDAPLVDFSRRMPYVEAQRILDEDYPARTMRYYWKSLNLLDLEDAAIDRIVEHAAKQPSPHSTTDIWHNGGAIRRVADDAMAFSGRHAPYGINPEANWSDPRDDQANVAWVRDFVEAMKPFSDGGRYLNFAGFLEEGESIMRTTFRAKYDRLAEIKRRYDPTNLFRLNQNVKPTS